MAEVRGGSVHQSDMMQLYAITRDWRLAGRRYVCTLMQKTPVFNTSKKDIGCQYSVVFEEKNKILVKSVVRRKIITIYDGFKKM
jgi:hypothetical protein